MRNLTVKQKNILDKFILSQIRINRGFYTSPFLNNCLCLNIDDLPNEIYNQLEKINNSEVLHQNVDRYLNDKSYGL
jgi:hypothetical protein